MLRRGVAKIRRPVFLTLVVPAVGIFLVFIALASALFLADSRLGYVLFPLILISAFGAVGYYLYELYGKKY